MSIRRGWVAVGLTAAAALAGAPPASAAADFRYPVTARATLRDVPDTELTFRAAAGAAYQLTAHGLSARPVTALDAGDNIGNTFAISCTGDAVGAEAGGYWATNLVPPQDTQVQPRLRWLLTAAADGPVTCRLKVASYSTIVSAGRQVTMVIPAGVRLRRGGVTRAARWTLPAESRTLVTAGGTADLVQASYPLRPGRAVRVVQDAALSTCKASSSIPGCTGGAAGVDGSTVDTWLRLQPRTADGADCGPAALAAPHTISTAQHHLSVTHTRTLDAAALAGCAAVEVALVVTHLSGNPVLIHAGHSGGHAATRGYAHTPG